MFCKNLAFNSQISQFVIDRNCDKFKIILKKCPNVTSLQILKILINKSLIEWISNNCKQLVCIHIFWPKHSISEQNFKEIGKKFSDKIEIEIIFGNEMRAISYV
jgi:hypothetical protein